MGYTCAHFGKWHLRSNPGEYGYAFHDGETTNNEGNERIPGDPKRMYSLTEKSINFMKDRVKADQPFYLQISHWAMHEGRESLPETRKKYQMMPELQAYYRREGETPESINYKRDPATWFAMGENLDECIGLVMESIKDLGIDDNTYVVMTTDNGYRHHELTDVNPDMTQPLHGHKWWVWQAGIRVPLLVNGPGIQAGSQSDVSVVNYDFLPTFVEWAGGNPNDLVDIDGKSLAGLLQGEIPASDLVNRNLYFHYPHYRTTMPHSAVISAGKWKVMHFYEAPDVPVLFNLQEDIGEVKNIAKLHPLKHDMYLNEMFRYFEKVGARIPKKNPAYDPAVYKAAKEYETRMKWGPFEGNRPLDEDEK